MATTVKRAAARGPVTVVIPRNAAKDIERFQKIQRSVLGKLGCLACCSGFDIRWVEEEIFVADAAGGLQKIGG